MKKSSVIVKLQTSLEARPIAVLVQVASKYESRIYLETEGKKVNAKSIMGMMSLGLDTGEEVMVTADGVDEIEAVEGIEKYLCGLGA